MSACLRLCKYMLQGHLSLSYRIFNKYYWLLNLIIHMIMESEVLIKCQKLNREQL